MAGDRMEERERLPETNVWPLPPEDEAMIREHHLTDQGYERCVICRLLSTIDRERENARRLEGLVRSGVATRTPPTRPTDGRLMR